MKNIPIVILMLLTLGSCKKKEIQEEKYDNGQVKSRFEVIKNSQGSFVKDGEYSHYYKNGQIGEQGYYSNGKIDGKASGWHENGKLSFTENFDNGQLDGTALYYDSQGKASQKINYHKGVADGEYQCYLNGLLQITGNFKNKKPDGHWVLLDENTQKEIASADFTLDNQTPVINSAIKGKGLTKAVSVLGFELGNATYPEVKLGFLGKGAIPGQEKELNTVTNGRVLSFPGSWIGEDYIKNTEWYFDTNNVLVGAKIVTDENNPDEYWLEGYSNIFQ